MMSPGWGGTSWSRTPPGHGLPLDQAQGVVLDLSVWDGSMDELGDVLARVQGKLRADGSPVKIQEVIITGR